jgi:hypothetical protein
MNRNLPHSAGPSLSALEDLCLCSAEDNITLIGQPSLVSEIDCGLDFLAFRR